MIEGLACAWPTGSVGSRESPADAGVSRWTDRAGQQAAPAWSPERRIHQQGWHRSDGRDEVADRAGTNPAGMGSFKL